ncbi:MAG TPA: hypothetical protein PLS95_19970, partial [Thermoanaerobaculales bacterium]|nr:hypothetical protein [Thermoanaerobaculales bacterium]
MLAWELLVLTVILGCGCLAATRIARRLLPGAPLSVYCIGSGTLAFGLLVLLVFVTSALGAFSLVPMAVSSLLGWIVVRLLVRVPEQAGPEGGYLHEAARYLVKPRRLFLGFPLVLALAIATARGLLMPPLAWDSLTYHLVFAGTWVQQGRISSFVSPGGMDGYSHFPVFGEVLPAVLMLPFRSDLLVNLAGIPYLLLAWVATWAASRELGVHRSFSFLVASLVLSTPALFAYATTAYVDIPAT